MENGGDLEKEGRWYAPAHPSHRRLTTILLLLAALFSLVYAASVFFPFGPPEQARKDAFEKIYNNKDWGATKDASGDWSVSGPGSTLADTSSSLLL